jgi:hypothetical protein
MTSATTPRDNLLTVGAIALVAMSLVTFDHEALGHGGACLATGGQIQLLTSALFHCSHASPLIDMAGPLSNLLLGGLALLLSARVPVRRPELKLLLTFVAAFSLFWEGGYTARAMIEADGDLYFAARDLTGGDALWWRGILGAAGVALYGLTLVVTSRRLTELWPDRADARRIARTAWLVATAGAALAAVLYRGPDEGQDLHDAVFEIGLASIPLLLIPGGKAAEAPDTAAPIAFRPALVAAGIAVFAVFAAGMGHGLRTL